MPDAAASGRLACERCLAFLGPSELHQSVESGRTPLDVAERWCTVDQRIVPCGCGVLYCSRKCADADTACGHSLLCEDGGGGEASSELAAWRQQMAEAELPELDLAARLLVARLCWQGRLPGGRAGVGGAVSKREAAASSVALNLVQEPLATVLGRDASGQEGAAHTLRDVRQSCALLRAALLGQLKAAAAAGVSRAQIEGACTMEGPHSFGNLVASALLNQCAVTVRSPAHALPPTAARRGAARRVQEPPPEPEPLDATGFFWFVCMMNHDCAPNGGVAYDPPSGAPPHPRHAPHRGGGECAVSPPAAPHGLSALSD